MTIDQKAHIKSLFLVEDCGNCAFRRECDELINKTQNKETFISICSALGVSEK